MSIVTGPVIGAIGGVVAMKVGKRMNENDAIKNKIKRFLVDKTNELTESSKDLDIAYENGSQYYSNFKDQKNGRTIIRDKDTKGQKVTSISYPDSDKIEFLSTWNPKTNQETVKHFNQDGLEDTKVYLAEEYVKMKKEQQLKHTLKPFRKVVKKVANNPKLHEATVQRNIKHVPEL